LPAKKSAVQDRFINEKITPFIKISFKIFDFCKDEYNTMWYGNNNNNNIAFFSQASWGRLEMKPERNKFKVQAH